MKIFHFLLRILRWILFLLLVALAAKNTEPVAVNFFLDHSWHVPLAGLLLLFFVLGAGLALLVCMTRLFQDKREIQSLRRELGMDSKLPKAEAGRKAASPPPPDAVL